MTRGNRFAAAFLLTAAVDILGVPLVGLPYAFPAAVCVGLATWILTAPRVQLVQSEDYEAAE